MSDSPEDLAREMEFYRHSIDPVVQRLLASSEPWDSYDVAVDLRGEIAEGLEWLPHGGQVFTVWADLEDLYDMGKTPISDAQAALRAAAADWLDRSSTEPWTVEAWIERATALVGAVAERDGTFWDSPNPDSPKLDWLGNLPGGPPLRAELARLVDEDGGRDDAENTYFEAANDPQFRANETAQRRFRGQIQRRLRRRRSTQG